VNLQISHHGGRPDQFHILETWINGTKVAENGKSLINKTILSGDTLNQFNCSPRSISDFQYKASGEYPFPLIEALDGQLITNKIFEQPGKENGFFVADASRDILKLVVVNRYRDEPPAIAFIKNTGIKQGAIASSVDSHNIVVGTDMKHQESSKHGHSPRRRVHLRIISKVFPPIAGTDE
jgi:adenine deaminase